MVQKDNSIPGGRLLCALLLLASLLLLFILPWVRLTGLSREELSSAQASLEEEIEADVRDLSASETIDKELFGRNGVYLDDASLQKTATALKNAAALVTDGKTNPLKLLRLCVFAQGMLKTTDTLYRMDETVTLFQCVGAGKDYQDFRDIYSACRPYAAVFIVYIALFGLAVVLGLFGVIKTLASRGKSGDALYFICVLLLVLFFAAAAFAGNYFFGATGSENMRLSLCPAAIAAAALSLVELVLKRALQKRSLI